MRSDQGRIRRRVVALGAIVALSLSACSSGTTADEVVTVTSRVQVPASTSAASGSGAAGPAWTPTNSPTSAPSSAKPAASNPAATPSPAKPTATGPAPSPKPTTDPGAKPPIDTSKDTEVWPDNSMVSHIFFHSLVIDAKRAFADKESGRGYLDYMVTQYEFAKILDQLYAKGWVLVSPHQLATVQADGKVVPKVLKLPKGKKPLVVSIDDVSYYEYMDGDGFATDLFVAKNGRVLNRYTDASGVTHEGSYDVMSMIDDFVRKHPDFSHAGARGVIALTGYNGVLGYRSSPSEYSGKNPNLKQDIATAKKVAQALKDEGWEFASHSWGHINFTKSSLGSIQADTAKWKSDVEPVVGPTDLLIYPFGADISGVPKYAGDKFDYLKRQGYSFFFNVDGSTVAWGQWGQRYLREARINIDGLSLKAALAGRKVLNAFFDPKSVIDPARPASIAGE